MTAKPSGQNWWRVREREQAVRTTRLGNNADVVPQREDDGGRTFNIHIVGKKNRGLPLPIIIAGISLFTVVIHLLIPIAPALIAVLLPAVVALARNLDGNA